jgi:1-aminocyclopropane-1-carboxylate deaminase
MRLLYISRHAYRDKTDPLFVEQLKISYGDFYMIPEGGSNELAVKGLEQFAKELNCDADYICCPVGTGGTMAGIIRGLDGSQKIIGFSALKGGAFLNEAVRILSGKNQSNWEINTDYHFGGYAKSTTSLDMFVKRFMEVHQVPLEFIYTGKMMSGIFDLAAKGFFARGSTVLAIHTGGIRPHK